MFIGYFYYFQLTSHIFQKDYLNTLENIRENYFYLSFFIDRQFMAKTQSIFVHKYMMLLSHANQAAFFIKLININILVKIPFIFLYYNYYY